MSGAVAALLICVAGGIGAALRLILDGLIKARIRSSYPVGTTVINVTGILLARTPHRSCNEPSDAPAMAASCWHRPTWRLHHLQHRQLRDRSAHRRSPLCRRRVQWARHAHRMHRCRCAGLCHSVRRSFDESVHGIIGRSVPVKFGSGGFCGLSLAQTRKKMPTSNMKIPSHRLMLMPAAFAISAAEVKNPAIVSMIPYTVKRPPIKNRRSNSLLAAECVTSYSSLSLAPSGRVSTA